MRKTYLGEKQVLWRKRYMLRIHARQCGGDLGVEMINDQRFNGRFVQLVDCY